MDVAKAKPAKKTVQISKESHDSLVEYCKRLGLKINAFVEKLIKQNIK
jgi:predicted HicB family RNase H-like nuclease